MWREQVGADWFFMGTNAITLDGELVNIDGNANRLALLLHGPKHVCVIAGMNKVVADVESGLKRIRTVTCPPTPRAYTPAPRANSPASARTATPRNACAARRSSPATRATMGASTSSSSERTSAFKNLRVGEPDRKGHP